MVSTVRHDQQAPGRLESVRELLNTWLIPNDTRVPVDRFDAYARDEGISPRDRADLRGLRDVLRAAVQGDPDGEVALDPWIGRAGIAPAVRDGELHFAPKRGAVGETLGIVLEAVASGQWHRLKACPDCRWVFYDHTRNASKRWCLMTAGGPNGRSCGSIDKVRRFRERQRSAVGAPTGPP